MSIKKIVIGLTLSLLLASGVANADWGDVYYCQMTTFKSFTPEGEQSHHKLDKFQFKLDQTKKAMVFGSSGYFADTVSKLTEGRYWPSEESWWASDNYSLTHFNQGKLIEAHVSPGGIKAMTADCDKF